ncbi:hypothetical protein B0I32_14522 [Nonomuraea fuscirosea]|uniref:DUF6545 domain-containing protein n=2 Tax=Nonomuraea fuscirosea TaxID=1291556 RepID=A0A2T0LS27_9ACTN|nr:hypothetical protein B0I32_14522 [Nonomuraea fuscirosea]
MSSAIIALALVPMWIIALLRLPGIRRSPRHFLIAVALTSGCLNATFAPQPAVHSWLIQISGLPGLPFAAEMATGIIALSAVHGWLLMGWAADRRESMTVLWRTWAVAGALIAITSTLALTQHLNSAFTYHAVGHHHASPGQMITLAVYEGYLLFVFVSATIFFTLLARTSASRLTKTGLYLMAIGNFGGARSAYTLLYLVPDALPGIPSWPWPWSADLAAVINYPGYALGFIGLALPALALPLHWHRARRDLRLISPLWRDLRTAYPSVIRIHERLPTGALLIAAVTEIHDALGLLAAWPQSTALLAEARSAVEAADLPEDRLEAAAYAAWIAAALAQKPDLSSEHSTWTYGQTAQDDIPGGISWIAAIAREYSAGPLPLTSNATAS